MDFGKAIEALKEGKILARNTFTPGEFIFMQVRLVESSFRLPIL